MRYLWLIFVSILLASGCTSWRPLPLFPPVTVDTDAPKPYLGIAHQVADSLPQIKATRDVTAGLQVRRVAPNTPAFRSGLKADDIIIGLDDYRFQMPPDQLETAFNHYFLRHQPGDKLRLTIVRLENFSQVKIDGETVTDTARPAEIDTFIKSAPVGSVVETRTPRQWVKKALVVTLGQRHDFAEPALPAFESTALGQALTATPKQSFWQAHAAEVVARYDLTSEYDDLRQRLRDIEAGDDGFRLPVVAATHRHPFLLEDLGRYISDQLIATREEQLQTLFNDDLLPLFLTGNRTDASPLPIDLLPVDADSARAAAWFAAHLDTLITKVNAAYANINADDRAFLEKQWFELSDVFIKDIYIDVDPDEHRFRRNLRTIDLGQKVDLVALWQAYQHVARFIIETEAPIFNWIEAHPEITRWHTPHGVVCLGTTEQERWDNPQYRFIYDPGGNDFYADGTGATAGFAQPLAWIIDRDGDDAYQTTSPVAQASGIFGIAVLFDRAGADTYISSQWAQGAGFMGIGLLLDAAGDDTYRTAAFGQGSGLFGYGILADGAGDDRYHAAIHAQGVGFSHGLGLLLDHAGDDMGYCSGEYPTGYGTPGIFDAWAQGCGMGFRGIASGGLGLVVDAAGCDHWEAGNFSQGGGYYYGVGFFRAAGPQDDRYIGSRYGQAFSAHQAGGFFVDDGGNDVYTTRHGVVSGLAWDQCVSVFVDDSGNDRYEGGSFFSLGASAHNSICLFRDRGGQDQYVYSAGPGRAGGNSYHGGSSLTLFIDEGPELDDYTADSIENNVEQAWPEYGIFRDGSGILKSPLHKPVQAD